MSSAAFSQELPSEEELLSLVSNGLPPYWEVSGLEVVATSRGGDAARPEAIVRFEADASPKQDLFAQTGREGPYYLVVRTEDADATRRLYGFQELGYSAGQWSGSVTIENPVTGFGQPLDLFGGPTLEIGSEEATERLEALRDTALTGAIAAQESELVAVRAQHETAIAGLGASNARAISELSSAHVRELTELQSTNEAALAEAEAEGTRRVEEARRAYDAELAELTTEREPLVAEARAALAALLAEEQEAANAALVAQRAEATAELERLRREHAARRGVLIEEQRQQIAELATALATERQSLVRQVETADETILLQQRLLASLTERAAGSDAVLAAFNQAREARQAFFARLPQNWSGQVRCEAEQPEIYSYTGPVSIGLSDSASTTGRVGIIEMSNSVWGSRGSHPSLSLVLLDDGLTFPLTMRARITPWNNYATFPLDLFSVIDLTVSQDGRMQGATTQPVTVDQVSRDVTCTFLLGAVGQ
jgi:hypothetical protein